MAEEVPYELVLTANEQAMLHPWERRVRKSRRPDRAAALAALEPHKPLDRTWRARPAGELAEALDYAESRYRKAEAPPWSAQGEAVAAALFTHEWKRREGKKRDDASDVTQRPLWPLVDLWVAEAGARAALEALILESRIKASALPRSLTLTNDFRERTTYTGKARRMREVLCAIGEKEYADARDWIASVYDRLDGWERCFVAYLFPGEPEWAAREVVPALSTQNGSGEPCDWPGLFPTPALFLLPSLADVAAVVKILEETLSRDPAYSDGRVLTVLARHGKAVARALLGIAKERNSYRELECLHATRGTFIVEQMVECMTHRRWRDVTRRYFARHPDLGIPALANRLAANGRNKAVFVGPLEDLVEAHPDLAQSIGATLPGDARKWLGLDDDVDPPKATSAQPRRARRPKLPRGVALVLDEPDSDLSPAARRAWSNAAAGIRDGTAGLGPALGALLDTKERGAARRVGELARSWAAASDKENAGIAIKALAAAEGDAALGQLVMLRDLPLRALSQRAGKYVAEIKKKRRLNDDDLEDRKVSDFGLCADLSLALGSRSFGVRIGEGLTPQLTDAAGRPSARFPRMRKKDDPALYQRSKLMWDNIKNIGGLELRAQARRFEEAMVEERRWTRTSFERVIVPHPLLGFLARRIVWAVRKSSGLVPFRVAEDGTCSDEADEFFKLDARARIVIPHPLELGERIHAWSDLFGDYKLIQPFDQLGRINVPLDDVEKLLGDLPSITLGPKARFVLDGLGWAAGDFDYYSWDFSRNRRGATLRISLTQGAGDRFHAVVEAGPLDAIGASELARDLTKCGIRRKGD